jgi:hypothetical protein
VVASQLCEQVDLTRQLYQLASTQGLFLGLTGSDSQDCRLGRVDDGAELLDPIHAEVGDGEGATLNAQEIDAMSQKC